MMLFAVTVLIAAAPAFAAAHPVPLDKNTDAKKCLECHEDKAKGTQFTPRSQMGCLSCHEIRVNKDVTRVKLITTTPYALCLTCHADKNAADIKGTFIAGGSRLHEVPRSARQRQQEPVAEGELRRCKENLCLSCHKIGLDTPAKGSRHAALDMGCETCHVTHKTGERGKQEFDYHLTKSAPALCLDCHDPKDANLQKAHQNQPFATANCMKCHDPHQSKSPKLLQAFTHNPFENNMCETCHEPAKDGKVVLAAASAKDLCVTCHDDKAKQIEMRKCSIQARGRLHRLPQSACRQDSRIHQAGSGECCLACHADQAEQHKKKYLHQPAFEQGCATCHEPHGGDNEHLLRAAIRTRCALSAMVPSAARRSGSEHLVTIFNGK